MPVTDIPGSKIKGAGWAFDYNVLSFQNVVVLTGTTSAYASATTKSLINETTVANNASTEIISAPDSLSIDSKIDDGKADTGNVRSVNQSATAGEECSVTTTYKIANGAKKVCVLTFRVDVSS